MAKHGFHKTCAPFSELVAFLPPFFTFMPSDSNM
jgi:hypothetical protein